MKKKLAYRLLNAFITGAVVVFAALLLLLVYSYFN